MITILNVNEIIKQKDEVTLLGYYGVDNFGDDLMLQSIISDLSKLELKINIIAFREISWISKNQYPNISISCWPKSKIGKMKVFHQAVKNSSAVIWGGGTCFTDEDGDGFFKYMLYAKLLGKKIAYLGVGVGNLFKVIRKLKTIVLINLSDLLTLREKSSYEKTLKWCYINKKEKIKLVEDPANNLLRQMVKKLPSDGYGESGLVLAWRDLGRYENSTIGNDVDKIADLCVELCNKYEVNKITLIDTDSVVDRNINTILLKELNRYVPQLIVEYNQTKSYSEKLKILGDSLLIVTSRLHIGVAAKFLNRKCYIYNYSPKIGYFVSEENNKNIVLLNKDLS